MKKIIIALILISVLVFAFFVHGAMRDSATDVVISVSDDDPEMLAAINKARETLPDLINALHTPVNEKRYILIKGIFSEGGIVEHMWVADLIVQGDVFTGVLADEPVHIKKLRFKQKVSISRDQVSDWMIIQDGKAKGSFTTRVLLKRMTPEQRVALERGMPYKLE